VATCGRQATRRHGGAPCDGGDSDGRYAHDGGREWANQVKRGTTTAKTVEHFVGLAHGGFFGGSKEWRSVRGEEARARCTPAPLFHGSSRIHDPGRRPLGKGTGGPGIKFEGRAAARTVQRPGYPAMANAGPTNGSRLSHRPRFRPGRESEAHPIFCIVSRWAGHRRLQSPKVRRYLTTRPNDVALEDVKNRGGVDPGAHLPVPRRLVAWQGRYARLPLTSVATNPRPARA